MGISDKTRKMLWARSGNRCLLCRIELVQEELGTDINLIIGEECHIVSQKQNGPRGNFGFKGDYDGYENLVLLCANDHKRIDELVDIYTVQKLRTFKELHEQWVKTTLEKDASAFTSEINNIKSLPKIISGREIISIIDSAHFFEFDYDENGTDDEKLLIGALFENLEDNGDFLSELSYTERVKLELSLDKEIKDLSEMGYFLFGIRRRIKIINSNEKDLGWFETATLIAVKKSSPSIVGEFLIFKFVNTHRVN